MKNRITILIITFLFVFNIALNATTRKVLFIGNSYTYTNNMPLIVDSIASAMGDTLLYDSRTVGGYTLQQHSTDSVTINKIFSQQWDVVIIQEQSQMPAFPPAQVDTEVYPFARILDSFVHANDTCTQTMFMMTWGHANGDPTNCTTYPVICTYDGMQERLRESYLQMGSDNHTDVIPVGSAFKIMMDSAYSPWLYSPDSSHPVVAGSYLQACVVYSSIFHKSTRNCMYYDGLSNTDAALLQRIATKVVFDSLNLWQGTGHYPFAGFTITFAGYYNFNSTSPIICNHYWHFDDGTHDTSTNSSHSFGMGIHTITHTVFTNCFSETWADTVHVLESVDKHIKTENYIKIAQLNNGNIQFNFLTNDYNRIEIYDMKGSIIKTYTINSKYLQENFIKGLYVYKLLSDKGYETIIDKLIVY